MRIDIHKEVEIEPTIRTELLSSMFEVPAKTKLSVTLTGDLPLVMDNIEHPWNIGLIVGPSGSGKTLLLNETFGISNTLSWDKRSVIDDFPELHSMEDISRVCQSVGFNTIPSWLRPYSVLSNGEKFRVETARHLLSDRNPIVIDEFTSVVDRQVACFACHAIQKYIREKSKRLVVASCHYDIIDWLQPDWILEPGNPCRFTWRSLQPRPPITVAVSRVKYETWQLFKDFHYMSQDLNKAARCYGLYVATNSTKRTDGMAFGLSNDDLLSLKNRSSNNLEYGAGSWLPSSGYYGSGGDGEKDSRLLVSDGRGEVEYEHYGDAEVRCNHSADTSETPDKSLSQISGSELRLPIHRMEENSLWNISGESTGSTEIESKVRTTTGRGTAKRPIRFGKSNGETYRIACLCGILYRPHPKVRDIVGFTRMVTLPDFQGLGLAFVLANTVASAYKTLGFRLHSYPNHPAWIRSYQRSKDWMQIKEAGQFSPRRGSSSTVGGFGNHRCAVFQYIGSSMNKDEAERLIHGEN